MSSALVGGLLGLLGIVLGTALTTWTTQRTAAWSASQTQQATLRQELRSAVAQYASALLAYRLAEANHWSAQHHGGTPDGTTGREAYHLRGTVLEALYALELSTDDDQLIKLAGAAVDIAYNIRKANTQDEMGDRTHQVRKALGKVVEAAKTLLGETYLPDPGRRGANGAAPS